MHELVKEIERQLEMDRIEEGNMSAEDVLYIVKGFKRPYLNENQQIVLDWLKREQIKRSTLDILIIRELAELIHHGYFSEELVYKAFMEINRKQQAEVLQAFSQWALEQEESG